MKLPVYVKWIFKMFIAFVLFVHFRPAYCERHYLQYVYTVTSSGPVYSAVALCDDIQISHYCDKTRIWIRDTDLSADDWRSGPLEPHESRDWFLNLLYTLTNCTNSKCPELHTLQRRTGCEVMKSLSGEVESQTAYDEYGFDGVEFIYLNINTMQWMANSLSAEEIKMKWDMNTGRIEYLRSYLNQCMTWLSTYNSTKSPPKIDMFAIEAHHDRRKLNLTCMATSFYPKEIKIDITLNGIKLESLYSTGVRPNHDNTFQIRTTVEINREDKDGLECHVTHSNQTLRTKWDGNCKNCPESSITHVIVFVTLAIVPAALFIILCVSRKKKVKNCNLVNIALTGVFNKSSGSDEEHPGQLEGMQQLNGSLTNQNTDTN
ncbi:H-2 class I histocompatibility antigen, alpha chain-like [Misgurnus anguillicaudatus]|uniref:H-2 class I histocompatibility antigen, alpha chain-like n=1 Tax=Misgurnus anguillicaudatus TaxID=75329 RepID=UPI003CCF3432